MEKKKNQENKEILEKYLRIGPNKKNERDETNSVDEKKRNEKKKEKKEN